MAFSAQTAMFDVLLAVAVGSDVAHRKVPNAIPVALVTTGIAAQLVSNGRNACGLALVAFVVAGAVLLAGWRIRVIGGADVKVGAATAVWIGWERLPAYAAATALAGGAVALACYAANARAQQVGGALFNATARSRSVDCRAADARKSVPYVVAIAAGAVAAMSWGAWP